MKEVFGILPVIMAVPSYALYTRSVLKGKVLPHTYSWLIWSVLATIGYIAQMRSHAGPGAWNTGITALACFLIFLLSLKVGENKLTTFDKILFAVCVVTIGLRLATGSDTVATILAASAASIGFVFTIEKAYKKPQQENLQTFTINSLRNLLSLFAVTVVSFNTTFYPACMMLANFLVVLTIVIRRSVK